MYLTDLQMSPPRKVYIPKDRNISYFYNRIYKERITATIIKLEWLVSTVPV